MAAANEVSTAATAIILGRTGKPMQRRRHATIEVPEGAHALQRTEALQGGQAFRLALLGDFSGRANKGILETGDALAKRKPIKIDVDNLDNVIERMNLQVNVPVDEEGAVISAPIKSMDDFHPDQLVENLELFEELLSLRRNLQSKTGFDRAAKDKDG